MDQRTRDTSVVAPLGDVRTAHAYRKTRDRQVNNAKWELHHRTAEADSLLDANAKLKAALSDQKAATAEATTAATGLDIALDQCTKGARKGKVVRFLEGVGVGVALGAAVVLLK